MNLKIWQFVSIFLSALAPVMPILMPAAIASIFPVLVILYRRRSKAFLPVVGALGLFITALMITLIVEVPIDNQITQWKVGSLPGNWQQLRDRWETFHAMRTFAYLGGVALMLGSALFVESTPQKSA